MGYAAVGPNTIYPPRGYWHRHFNKYLDTSGASTIDKSWKKLKYGEERIILLPRVNQLQLASIWVEAREKGDWETFASHCVLISSHRFPTSNRDITQHYFKLNLLL